MLKLPKCHREGWIDCFFSIHKEANIDFMGLQYTSFFYACLLPKKGYSYFEAQNLCVHKAYMYELNLQGGALSMTLKLSPFINMSS